MGNNSEWEEVKPSVNPNNEWVDVSNQAKAMGMAPEPDQSSLKNRLLSTLPAVLGAGGGMIAGIPGALMGAAAGSTISHRFRGDEAPDNGQGLMGGSPLAKQVTRDTALYGAIPQLIGKAQNTFSKGVQSASDQADVTDLVKDPAKLGETVAGKLQDAQTMYNKRVIDPKMAEQRARADGLSTKFDIDAFSKAYPEVASHPDIAEHLEGMKNYKPDPYGQGGSVTTGGATKVTSQPGSYGGSTPVENEYSSYTDPQAPEPTSKVVSMPGGATTKEYFNNTEVPVKDLLELRSKLNNVSDYKPGDPFATEASKARYEQAQQAGDAVRSQIAQVDPDIANISQELRQDYNTRNAVMKTATKRPISSIEAKVGTDKASNLARFDQAAGSDLGAFGNKVATGAQQLGAPQDLASTAVDWKAKLFGMLPRAVNASAQAVNPLVQGLNRPNATANTLRALGVYLDAPAGSGSNKE